MAITELALLPLSPQLPSHEDLPTALLQNLRTAKRILEQANPHPCHFYRQDETPSFLYLITTWSSLAAHKAFLPSSENQELLALLRDQIVIDGGGEPEGNGIRMWHVDADIYAETGGNGEENEKKCVLEAPVVAVARYFVKREKKAQFTVQWEAVKALLEEATARYGVVAGWKVEDAGVAEVEEWVLFSGWESREQHNAFADGDVGRRYKKCLEYTEGFQARHFRALEGL